FWASELFLADGRPKYYANQARPVDAHNYAQAIDTWLAVADRRPDASSQAEHLARLLVDDLLAPAGFVYLEPPRPGSNRTAFVRWTPAPSFRALSHLLDYRRRSRDAAEQPDVHGVLPLAAAGEN